MKRLLFLLSIFIPFSPVYADNWNFLPVETSIFQYTGPSSWNAHPLQSSTDSLEVILRCQEPCAIDALCYKHDTTTGTPPAYQIDLEGVSTSTGRADGTVKSSGNAKAIFTPPAGSSQDGTVQCKSLNASYTCTRGEPIAGVIKYSSGTVNGSNDISVDYSNNNVVGFTVPYSYVVASGVGSDHSGPIPFAYKCGSTVYGNPVQSVETRDFGLDSSPDERANAFALPSGSCSTFKVGGVRWRGYLDCAGSTVKIQLYSGTSVLQSATIDCDQQRAQATPDQFEFYFTDATLSTLTCGNTYRLGIQPQVTGNPVDLDILTVHSAGDMSAYPLGTSMFASVRTDAGAWTDITTEREYIEPIITDVTASGGGGGVIGNPTNFSGGFQ